VGEIFSFGEWVRRRRKALDLTQDALARQVGCALSMVRKIEADERRPSRQIAELLADALAVPQAERDQFLRTARAELAPDRLTPPTEAILDRGHDPHGRSMRRPDMSPPRPGNLPTRLSSFIGRAAETQDVASLLQQPEVRLLTLTGPGGMGKTSLAIRVAASLADQYPDGVWFVDLAPVSDPQQVAATILQALGIPERAHTTVAALLQEWLRPRHLLLLLDNFEQLLDAAPLISTLLSTAPHIQALATSRAALQLQGEREYPLAALDLPPAPSPPGPLSHNGRGGSTAGGEGIAQYAAIALFVERAQAVVPSFALTPANAAAVAEICGRLDGLPLAIELAAARVRLFAPEALRDRLLSGGVLATLASRTRDMPSRQQTIRATIAWSYDLLSPADQALFVRLGVFVGGWTIPAAEAICANLELDVVEGLATLVEQSLVRPILTGGEPRFTMLETLREYALERLEAHKELGVVRQALAKVYCDFAAGLYTGGPTETARRQIVAHWAATEIDNLRAVVRWGIGQHNLDVVEPAFKLLGDCLLFRGQGRETEQWTREIVAAGGLAEQRPAFRASLLGTLCWSTAMRGEGEEAYVYGLESQKIYASLGERTGVAWVDRALAQAAILRGDQAAAQAYLEESLAISQETGEEAGLAFSWLDLGMLYLVLGDGSRAEHALRESLTWFQKTENVHGLIQVPAHLVQAALLIGDMPLARNRLRTCLIIDEVRQSTGFGVHPISVAAQFALACGQAERAARLFGLTQLLVERGAAAVSMTRILEARAVTQARSQLTPEAFDAAFAEGQRLTLDQAVALALALTEPAD
jgi:predicted ATPase/transcriptional regulator with XRE-family HTH domain